MPRLVNAILNKQFLRPAFELPAVGFDRWPQSEISAPLLPFTVSTPKAFGGSRDSGNEKCVGLFNPPGKIEDGLKVIGINEIRLAM